MRLQLSVDHISYILAFPFVPVDLSLEQSYCLLVVCPSFRALIIITVLVAPCLLLLLLLILLLLPVSTTSYYITVSVRLLAER